MKKIIKSLFVLFVAITVFNAKAYALNNTVRQYNDAAGHNGVKFSTSASKGSGITFVTYGWNITLDGSGSSVKVLVPVTPNFSTDITYIVPIGIKYVGGTTTSVEQAIINAYGKQSTQYSNFVDITSGNFNVHFEAHIQRYNNGSPSGKFADTLTQALHLVDDVGGWSTDTQNAFKDFYYNFNQALSCPPEPPSSGFITKKYYDLNGKSIHTFDVGNYALGKQVVSSIDIPGYTYKYNLLNGVGSQNSSSSATVNLTSTNLDQYVSFYYSSNAVPGTITINYLDNKGSQIIDPTTGKLKLPQIINIADVGKAPTIDDNYLASYKDNISGYDYPPSDYPLPLPQLNQSQTDVKINLIYAKSLLGNVTVKYVDQATNNDIATPTNFPKETEGQHVYSAKTITGYTLQGASTQMITVISGQSYTVTFKYSKDATSGSVTVKYINQSDNSSIAASDIFPNETPGSHTYNAKTVSGFTLQGASSQTINVAAGQSYTVTFKYSKDATSGSVTVKYIDQADGSDAAPADVFANETPGSHTYNAKTITGYTLQGATTQTISVAAGQSYTVTFNYSKDSLPTVYIPPIADFLMPAWEYEGNPVYIQDISTPAPGYKIDHWSWSSSDPENVAASLGDNPTGTVIFWNPGTYTVYLTVHQSPIDPTQTAALPNDGWSKKVAKVFGGSDNKN